MLKQHLHFKLSQKLSPQQIQLMKLVQLPTQAFEERIKQELEENLALERGKEDATEDFEEGYSNEEFEALYDSAMVETSDSLRWKLYSKMDSIIHNDMPVIPLFHDQVTHFVSNEVSGWKVSPVNRLDLRRVKLSCANAQN